MWPQGTPMGFPSTTCLQARPGRSRRQGLLATVPDAAPGRPLWPHNGGASVEQGGLLPRLPASDWLSCKVASRASHSGVSFLFACLECLRRLFPPSSDGRDQGRHGRRRGAARVVARHRPAHRHAAGGPWGTSGEALHVGRGANGPTCLHVEAVVEVIQRIASRHSKQVLRACMATSNARA